MEEKWTKSQKKHAGELFDLALKREYDELIETINDTKVETRDDVWELYEMLGKKRKELNGKYDYRYSQLIFVFAQLVRGGYLSLEELEPIGKEKQESIEKMIHFKGFEA
ncbi:MAG: hypothetical protein U9Q90_08170 [Campylobacterota bacterium]|nr:hypothetical protein [Campylobacterota bacterium]